MKIKTNISAGVGDKGTFVEDANGDLWIVYPNGTKKWFGPA